MYTSEMISGKGPLESVSVRMGMGHQKDQGVIKGLEFEHHPLPSREGRGLETELITSVQ